MDAKKIYFLGNTHIQGLGAEWPSIYNDIMRTPNEFKRNSWYNYLKTTDDFPLEIQNKFSKFTSDPPLASLKKKINTYREESSFASIIGKRYNVPVENLAFDAYNLYQIAARLVKSPHNFSESLVILGVPDLKNDLIFHSTPGSQKLQNVSVPYISSLLIMMAEFVENRGGRFTYFHVENYPEEFYDNKNNPFLYNLNNIQLFDLALHDLATKSYNRKKIDGKHYDSSGQKFLANKFIEEFENSMIYAILR